MTIAQSIYQRYKRYRTLQTDHISALPVVILMPHSACNCRCAMCDIWKGNARLKQLNRQDISELLKTFRKFGTRQVLMSGGEALLHPGFFDFCSLLKQENINVSLHSTGLTLKNHAENLVKYVQDIIISLDGDENTHDSIRNIPGAYKKLAEGIAAVRTLQPGYRITARTVIHRLNFRRWPFIIKAARELQLHQVSFLPADVSSTAFNREIPWTGERQGEVLPSKEEVAEMAKILEEILVRFKPEIESGFIAEPASRLQKIQLYYSAFYGQNEFPYKKCNAPWVSTVIEADGTVRPCFFHEAIGNIREKPLDEILNGPGALRFRKELDMSRNSTCIKCVCYLNLRPGQI